MLGTLVSIAVAALLSFRHVEIVNGNPHILAAGIALVGVLVGLVIPFMFALAWRPLQKAELTATPRVTELFHDDFYLNIIRYWGFLFPLLMFILALDLAITHYIPTTTLLGIAIILLGVTLDAIRFAIVRTSNYLSPSLTLDYFNAAAKKGIKDEQYGDVCAWVDAISEVGVQAARNGRLSLSMQVLDDIHDILKNFLTASKSISHHVPNLPEEQKGSGMDTVSYVLLFAFQRLEMINNKAAEMHLEPVCTHVVNILGKIALDAAQYDITTAQYPLLYLGRSTRTSINHNIPDVAFKSSISLSELAKMLPQKVDTTYLEIAPFYSTILSQLDQNAKSIFQNDKSISFDIILQPFNDIKNLFANSSHQDAPTILKITDNILEQFKTLQDVLSSMNTMPPPSPIDDQGLSSKIVDDLEQRLKK